MKELVAEYNQLLLKHFSDDIPIKKFRSIQKGTEELKILKKKIKDAQKIRPEEKEFIPKRGDKTKIQKTDTMTRAEAIKGGYTLYWNGIPCDNGHVSPRYAKSGHCKKCYQLFRGEEISQSEISKDRLSRGTKIN